MAKAEHRIPVVFEQVFSIAIQHMDAESAVGVASDAVDNYLEVTGLVKPVEPGSELEGIAVRIVNPVEVAAAIAKAQSPKKPAGPNLAVKEPGRRVMQ